MRKTYHIAVMFLVCVTPFFHTVSLADTNIPVRLSNGELNRAHPWFEDHQRQTTLIGMFRGILSITTPDPTNKVFSSEEDGIFSVVLECWSEYDLAEQEFTRLMGKAKATPQQAWNALRFSHRLRTSCGQLESHYFLTADNFEHDPDSEETRRHLLALHASVRKILKNVKSLSKHAPLGSRLAALAEQDLQHSLDAMQRDQRLLPRQWAKDAERTAKSAEALATLEINWSPSNNERVSERRSAL